LSGTHLVPDMSCIANRFRILHSEGTENQMVESRLALRFDRHEQGLHSRTERQDGDRDGVTGQCVQRAAVTGHSNGTATCPCRLTQPVPPPFFLQYAFLADRHAAAYDRRCPAPLQSPYGLLPAPPGTACPSINPHENATTKPRLNCHDQPTPPN